MTIHDSTEQAYRNGYETGVREFAERLKEKRCGGTYPYVLVNDIDTLVEELTVNYESSKQRKEDEE